MARTRQTSRGGRGRGGISRGTSSGRYSRGSFRGRGISSRSSSRGRGGGANIIESYNEQQIIDLEEFNKSDESQKIIQKDSTNKITINELYYDISYDTIFYSHTFECPNYGEKPKNNDEIFLPKFSLFQSKENYWLGLYFTSKFDGKGLTKETRPPINLVLALDISGSMSCQLTSDKSKLCLSKESILAVTKQLRDDDYFGFLVFNSSSSVLIELTKWSEINEMQLSKTINRLKPGGGTSLQDGLSTAANLLKNNLEFDDNDKRTNRICFMTDMESDEPNFIVDVKNYSAEGIYTTIIGVGMDLTRNSVIETSRTPGCNYCNVYSDDQFRQLMNDEFVYFVTPIAFNIEFEVKNQQNWKINQIYGSAEMDRPTSDGKIRFSSEFPNSTDNDGKIRSGGYIFSLISNGDNKCDLVTKISWENHQGICTSLEQNIPFASECFSCFSDTFSNSATSGLRKSVLLIHFVAFIKQQIKEFNAFVAAWNSMENDVLPSEVTIPNSNQLIEFISWFKAEISILGDDSLQKELSILQNYSTILQEFADAKLECIS